MKNIGFAAFTIASAAALLWDDESKFGISAFALADELR
jgi:hypothetical protein